MEFLCGFRGFGVADVCLRIQAAAPDGFRVQGFTSVLVSGSTVGVRLRTVIIT